MKYDLLNQLGLGEIDLSIFFFGLAGISLVLLIMVVIQMIQLQSLKKKYNKFMGGKDVKSLEKQLEKIVEDSDYILNISDENRKDIKNIKKELENSFNKIGIVKYDAFKQMGGKLSFSLALLNEINSGFIINSVHSSEGCYIYIKEIVAGLCDLDLSNEEKEALSQAMKNR